MCQGVEDLALAIGAEVEVVLGMNVLFCLYAADEGDLVGSSVNWLLATQMDDKMLVGLSGLASGSITSSRHMVDRV